MRSNDNREWPARVEGRPRVLVEHADGAVGFAMEKLLQHSGFDVQYCGGPDHLRRHACPLVKEGRCALVEETDVVVHSLNPDRGDHEAVLRAIRLLHPDTPVVVEMPKPGIQAHAELLEGCTVVPVPATRATLIDAVDRALTSAT